MKRSFSLGGLLALALLVVGAGSADAQTSNLGYVYSQRLVQEAPGAAAAREAFERDMAGFRTQVEALGQELEKMEADYQAQQATLSEAARQQRQQQFQQKFVTAQDSVAKLEQKAQERQAQFSETMRPIMERIDQAIEAVRREGNFAIIFDAGSSGMVAADPALDITNRVLARLTAAPGGGE